MSSYVQLLDNLDRLKLTKVKEYLPHYLDENVAKEMSFTEALKELTEKELAFREERASAIGLKKSRFPYQKGIRDFNFGYQPSISKAQILDFSSLRFLETADNILFIGSSGVGKTHLATAIGIEASNRRVSTYFIHFTDLVTKLKRAYAENRQERVIKHFARYRLLIIDEIGYLPIEKEYSNLFFQLIASRYERRSTIITTNQPLSRWGEVFGDPTIATAIIDRLVHHSSIVKITGRSYRIKDKIVNEEPELSERGRN
jgi:DNA replication protein DnaC